MSEEKLTETELAILDALRKGMTSRGDISKHVMKIVAKSRQYGGSAALRGFAIVFGDSLESLVKKGILEKKGGIFGEKYSLTDKGKEVVAKYEEELNKLKVD